MVSNIFPERVRALVDCFLDGRIGEARTIHYSLLSLFSMAFVETNPIPVKAILSWMGLCTNELRLPMTPLSEGQNSEQLKKLINSLLEKGFA